MSFFESNCVFYSPTSDSDGSHQFSDKRNRNPNWTDTEIIRFLEILQEEDTMKDLMAQRNKQVFCYVAQRMCAEGADKTWDQCRIKLKNLKSQYRYVKDRIPNIDDLDLEDDDVVKELITKCQGRGISPSSIKHLRFLKRFLSRQSSATFESATRSSSSTPPGSISVPMTISTTSASSPLRKILLAAKPPQHVIIPQKPSFMLNRTTIQIAEPPNQDEESVSPPTTPVPSQSIKIISSADTQSLDGGEPESKRSRLEEVISSNGLSHTATDDLDLNSDGYKYIEKFNRDMMDQFLEFQRRSQASFIRWEQERVRQEHLALERWRQEARDHEKQLFGMFCHAMAQCNAALTTMLKSSKSGVNVKHETPEPEDSDENDADSSVEQQEEERNGSRSSLS